MDVDGFKNLAAAIIASAIKDYDLGFLRSEMCEQLCAFIGLGVSGKEMADRLEQRGPIRFSKPWKAMLKELSEWDG